MSTFQIEVQGLARPVTVRAEYEDPDRACGISGGWFMVEAVLDTGTRYRPVIGRDEFAHLFGWTALRVAEENISDMAYERTLEREREEELDAAVATLAALGDSK